MSPVLDLGRGCTLLPFPNTGFTSSSSPNLFTFKLLASLQQSSAILHQWNEDSEEPFLIRLISYRFGLFTFPLQ